MASATIDPAGVGRNTARGTATFTTNLRVSRAFALGGQRTGGFPGGRGPRRWWRWIRTGRTRPVAGGGASVGETLLAQGQGGRGGGGGGRGGNQGDAAFNARYMMELFVTADNLFNRVNYGGYSGNLLSPYYGAADDGPAAAPGAGRDAVPVLTGLCRLLAPGSVPAYRAWPSTGDRRPSDQSRIESPM